MEFSSKLKDTSKKSERKQTIKEFKRVEQRGRGREAGRENLNIQQ